MDLQAKFINGVMIIIVMIKSCNMVSELWKILSASKSVYLLPLLCEDRVIRCAHEVLDELFIIFRRLSLISIISELILVIFGTCSSSIMSTIASYSSVMVGYTSLSTMLDCHHPYYLHPSDSLGMQFTTVVLTQSNYNQWHRSIEIALSSKLKLGFVDGSYTKLVATSPLLVHWIWCNNIVTSWLLNYVSVDIWNSVVYIPSAHDIWLDLEVHFAESNVPKLFYSRKEIAHLTQGSLSISAYFTKFRTLHDELECLYSKPQCSCNHWTCSVNGKLNDLDQSIQITQFLMGLIILLLAFEVRFLLWNHWIP